MALSKIKHVRAFVARGAGGDYHDQGAGHWIDDHIATPMSRYPEYRQSRQSFGINVLGTWSSRSRRKTARSASR